MPLGQSALVTAAVHTTTRGLLFMALRCLGKTQVESNLVASNISIKVAAAAGSTTAVITADPAGAVLSAGYLGMAMGETNAWMRDLQRKASPPQRR